MKRSVYGFLLGLLTLTIPTAGQTFTLRSPDNKLTLTVTAGNRLRYRMDYNGQAILNDSPVSMTLAGDKKLGVNSNLQNAKTASVNKEVKPLYGISSTIKDQYNELTLNFRDKFSVAFRAYNSGAAYRFIT